MADLQSPSADWPLATPWARTRRQKRRGEGRPPHWGANRFLARFSDPRKLHCEPPKKVSLSVVGDSEGTGPRSLCKDTATFLRRARAASLNAMGSRFGALFEEEYDKIAPVIACTLPALTDSIPKERDGSLQER